MLKAFNENDEYINKYEVIITGIPEVPYGYITVKANSPEHSISLILKHLGYTGVLSTDNRRKQEHSAFVVSKDNIGKRDKVFYSITKLNRI